MVIHLSSSTKEYRFAFIRTHIRQAMLILKLLEKVPVLDKHTISAYIGMNEKTAYMTCSGGGLGLPKVTIRGERTLFFLTDVRTKHAS